ncbi:hypothetical protein ACQW02_09570 [Humitalea sp. 24SJ18S-53]|uniref:hypothetical protein n=1 Tax=Humitalea sp. 24SJ18S-53 TaxID=3422307 RepID=UPI003D664B50
MCPFRLTLQAAIAGTILLLVSASSAEQAPRLTMIGMGAGVTCAEWMETARYDGGLEQWAFGFASAMAASTQVQIGTDPLAAFDRPGIHAWLAVYCSDRPTDALTVALIRMVFSTMR